MFYLYNRLIFNHKSAGMGDSKKGLNPHTCGSVIVKFPGGWQGLQSIGPRAD